jgi:sortase A
VGLRRAAGTFGRLLVLTGVVVLLFVAYQLWGTGLAEAKSQQALRRQLSHQLSHPAAPPAHSAATSARSPTTSARPDPAPPPPQGHAIALIRIPSILVNKAVVQGVGEQDLRMGPGHYPTTPMPGQPGNSAIAGHRTTYGAPFFRLNELVRGDPIYITTRQGRFEYKVLRSMVVAPNDLAVLDRTRRPELTLTTCTPRYSAADRLVVQALLVGHPAAPTPIQSPAASQRATAGGRDNPTLAGGLAGGTGSFLPSIEWGLVLLGAFCATWLLGHYWRLRRHSRAGQWVTWIVGTPVCLAILFFFFQQVSVLVPASF